MSRGNKGQPAAAAALSVQSQSDTDLSKTDEFIAQLLDARVAEALAKAIAPIIARELNERLGKRLEELTKAINEVKKDNSRLHKQCSDLVTENVALRKEVSEQGS